jgi:hypothetical protein
MVGSERRLNDKEFETKIGCRNASPGVKATKMGLYKGCDRFYLCI